MGKKTQRRSAAKYYLDNYHCGQCQTGVVQIHREWKRGGIVTTLVSGCLDCGHDYGIRQAADLKLCDNDFETYWP